LRAVRVAARNPACGEDALTYSLVAYDAETESYATAVKTSVPCIGGLTPHASHNGAVCSQAFFNAEICYRTLQLLDMGVSIEPAMRLALAEDFAPEHRQVHGVGRGGTAFAHTGPEAVAERGHRTGDGYSVAGNHLANIDVIDAIADAWEAGGGAELVTRLIDALAAGEEAGGEWVDEGWPLKSSAAVLVASSNPRWSHSLRVDASDTPLEDVRRVHQAAEVAEGWAGEFFSDIGVVAPIHWTNSRAPRPRRAD
jgi:uncharacterized Ntn-hydrolase superfamily protein